MAIPGSITWYTRSDIYISTFKQHQPFNKCYISKSRLFTLYLYMYYMYAQNDHYTM